MKKKSIKYIKCLFPLLSLFIVTSISSQNIINEMAFSKNMKLIEKEKFSKALKKIEKQLEKDKNDIRYNFAISIIYGSRNFKKYNPKNAYNHLLISNKEYNSILEEKKLQKLEKIPINDSVYTYYFKHICDQALDDAILLNTIDGYELYLNTYRKASSENKQTIIEQRNAVAFNQALNKHTIDGYKYFIETYTNADQINQAWDQIYIIAFNQAEANHTIKEYEDFIVSYPHAPQVRLAHENIHEIAFNNAKEKNTSEAYKYFLDKYGNSKQYNQAFELYETSEFLENTSDNNWISYRDFIINYYNNSKISQAKDSIFSIGVRHKVIPALEYCINTNNNREDAIERLYPIFTMDGEESSINLFIQKYGYPYSYDVQADLINAASSKSLLLNLPYDRKNKQEYENFIVNSAPSELAFVALQRLISYELSKKRWTSAISKMQKYDGLFANHKNFNNLEEILSKSYDKKIISQSVGKYINTSSGEEYGPVISADNKLLYFCGKNRKDNIGNEDIFVSFNKRGSWRSANIIDDLSTANYNEATVNISSDGTTLIIFREGKLLYSERISNGWSQPVELPDNINAGSWNSDATISSNGEALIFSSVRDENLNLYNTNENNYHGDNQYPSDIYVSLRDENDIWGEPFNIGDSINTIFTERSPFLHPDMKTLYFSSDGHGGLGKLDVFMSTRLYDSCWTCWSDPINLGKEINTIESDWGYKISTDGKTAYFTKEKTNYKESSLLLLLDISGSMGGSKLRSLKEAAKDVCKNAINNNSQVSIMAFEGECYNPIDTMINFTNDLQAVEEFIDALRAQGGTPMYNAYIDASRHISKNASRSNNKMIILMTDGAASACGKTLDETLRNVKHNGYKIKTQTIAFMVDSGGSAYNELYKIADYTNGELFYAENTNSLKSTFSKATTSLYGINTASSKKDIYTINLPNHLRPDLVATISGKLLDSKNNPIDATIRFEDLETNKLVGKIKNNPEDGTYFIVLPLGKLYGLYVDKESYFPISNNLDLRNENQIIEIENNIPLYTFSEMINNGIAVPINNIFFDSGLSKLKSYSIPELTRIAEIIIKNDLTVELSGHTDNVDTEEFNLKLSEDRASSVKEFLVNVGCDENKILTIGHGETQPLNNNASSQERKQNRRVEFRFIK